MKVAALTKPPALIVGGPAVALPETWKASTQTDDPAYVASCVPVATMLNTCVPADSPLTLQIGVCAFAGVA
jgi:hypothetical protein